MIASKIIAHRGVSSLYPENTLSAMQSAVAHGVSWVECDVQLTKDNVPIIFHDLTLERTTTLQGSVPETLSSEILCADVGTWVDPKFSHERIPVLDELINTIHTHKLGLNLEIKYHAKYHNSLSLAAQEEIVSTIFAELQDNYPKHGFLVSSFSYVFLTKLRELDSAVNIGYLPLIYEHKLLDRAQTLKAVSIHIRASMLESATEGDVESLALLHDIKAQGFDIYVYTINTVEMAKKLFDIGVDGVFTDYPQLLAPAI